MNRTTFLAGFDPDLRRKIMVENAKNFYGPRLNQNIA